MMRKVLTVQIRLIGQLLLLAGLLFCMGCKSDTAGSETKVQKEDNRGKVSIYMYGNFPEKKARMLADEMKKYFQEVELMKDRLSLPDSAFVKGRNRYQGRGLLDDLKTHQQGNTVLGLTDRIICHKNELSPDFGIMGLSYRSRGLAVVSTTIPKNGKIQTDSNFIKLTLHELGHAFGLPHCPDQKCYMVDAEHKMKLPQTIGFCTNCQKFLQSKGVKL